MSFAKIAKETLEKTSSFDDVSKFVYYGENRESNASGTYTPTIRFMKKTTIGAVADLADMCVALNFASARHPGGGFMGGAIAQEEDLCRKSSLYHSISACTPFYQGVKDTLYTDRIIYSPKVFIVRDEQFGFIEPSIQCRMITCAAPNNSGQRKHDEKLLKEIFERRISNVLDVASQHKNTTIVLGAWGCGAFGNDPKLVAEAFKKVITRYSFEQIVFAIPDDKNLDVFKSILM